MVKTMNKHNNGTAYKPPLAFDAATKRRFDDNGFMHVDACHITKEQVAPYYGHEIPDYERFNLDPHKIYYGYRSAEELQKGLETFNGLPLLLHHHPESADEPQKEYRVGSVGTSAEWNAPYIDNVLSITDKVGIKAVKDGVCRQISSAYQYDPDFTKGEFEGKPYDFIMRNIRGNHVALVEEGRAGPDVVVADAQIVNPQKGKSVMMKLKDFFRGAWDSDIEDEVTEDGADKVVKVKAIIESIKDVIPPEKLAELEGILDEMAEVGEDEEPVDPVDAIAKEKITEKFDEDKPEEKEEEVEVEEETEDEDKIHDGLNAEEAYKLGEKDQIRKEEREEIPGGEDDNTAELIAAGENHERDKLMSEHMDAADRAWDACGMDSDDPAIKAAFSKGFAWGMKDGEKNAKRHAALAQDAAINGAIDRATKKLEAQFEAAAEVGKVIGNVKAMAFDSVSGIYAHALSEMGIPSSAYSAESAKDVFNIIVKQREVQLAQDANLAVPSKKYSGAFAGLNDIK